MGDTTSALDLKTKYDEATRQAVEILKEANPVKIIHFGSTVWSTPHEHSDLDLCVVVERKDERPIHHLRRDLNRLLWSRYKLSDVEIELHVYYRDTFEDYLRRGDPFLHEVVKGIVVYEALEKARESLKEPPAPHGPNRRTHNLVALLNRCTPFDESFEELRETCIALNDYYADTRYPDAPKFDVAFSSEETDVALTHAEIVLDFVRSRIEKPSSG